MQFTSREEANQFYADQLEIATEHSPDVVDHLMRELALNDLWFLMTIGLGRSDMNERPEIDPDWLFARCQEIQNEPDGYLDLWAREHYKSTVITFGKTIQDILNDPEITVGIFSVKRELAQDFLKQIKQEFENNDLLKRLFPDVLYLQPESDSPCWGIDKGIRVKRTGNSREETVEAWGLINGQPIGKHFKLLIYDDVVTDKSVTNNEMLTKTFDALRLSFSLGSHGGKRRMIGTRYHLSDAWGRVMDAGTAVQRIHPATDNGKPDGKSVFLRQDLLDEKRRDQGPYIFACQMLQDPKADEAQGFDKMWIRPWTPQYEHWSRMNIYIVVDPSSGKKMKRSNNDYTVIWVIGLGQDERYYLIDGLRDRLNLTARAKHLFRLVRSYKPVAVGYEEYGLQADIEHMEYQMAQVNFHFDITPLGGSMAKEDRIKKLIPLFEQGRFFTPGILPYCDREGSHRDIIREFVDEEFVPFPSVTHDDMLDNLANILHPDLAAVFPDPDEFVKIRGGYENLPEGGNVSAGVHDYDPLGAM